MFLNIRNPAAAWNTPTDGLKLQSHKELALYIQTRARKNNTTRN